MFIAEDPYADAVDAGGVRHDAQTCYCDEPNCVGTIGGKTQTDVGGMDELYLDGASTAQTCRAGHVMLTLSLDRLSSRYCGRGGEAGSEGDKEEEGQEAR